MTQRLVCILGALLLLVACGASNLWAADNFDDDEISNTAWTSLEKGNWGIGTGLAYGGLGAKYETAALGGNITATLAPGLTASNVGARFYLPVGANPGARNFIVARYGIMMTSIKTTRYSGYYGSGEDTEIKTYTGFAIGVGRRWSHWELEFGWHPQPSSWSEDDTDAFLPGIGWIPVYFGFGYNF